MLELDTIRGPHSTGVFSVKSNRASVLVKTLGTPWEFYENKKSDECFAGIVKVLIGHNRWATKGAINRRNAHPFEFERVAGVHNGTLTTVHNLDDNNRFEVDSENIYHCINKNGAEDTLPKLRGAYALAWYDKVHHTVNLARNKERPLFLTMAQDNKTLIYASEPWIIEVAAARHGVKISQVVPLPVDTLYTFDVPQFATDEFAPPVETPFESHQPYTATNTNVSVFPRQEQKSTTSGRELRPSTTVAQSTGKIKRPYAEYSKFIGQDTQFYVDGRAVNSYGQEFIQCWACDDDNIAIRVYTDAESELGKKLLGSVNFFTAIPKSFSSLDNGSLVIDLRSVKEVFPAEQDDDEPLLFVGFEGEVLTPEEYDARAKCGCSWCSTKVTRKDADDLTWVSRGAFLCGDCSSQQEVVSYVATAGV